MEKTKPEEAVWNILNRNLFFVREAIKARELKTSDKFDIFDPDSQQIVLECREPEICGLTKIARAFGGRHDVGTPFDLVANLPAKGQQACRIARGSTTFTLGNAPVDVFDHANELIGRMKKRVFSFGLKFGFVGNRQHDSFTLELKSNFLGNDCKLLIGDKEVGRLVSAWKEDHVEFFKQGNFGYAISITPEVPTNKPLRQVLLAFCVAFHRIRK